jgi:hypothetical protein
MWGLFKQDKLIRISSIRKPELAALIRFPHGFLHLLEAEQLIGCVKQIVVRHVAFVGHFEGAHVRSLRVQLPKIKVVEASVSCSGIGCVDASFPFLCPEEAVEVWGLIRMADEPVDFLVHEVDENLAAAMGHNLLDQTEGRPRPSEWIDKGEGRNEAAVAHETRVKPSERGLKRDAAFNYNAEIRW